ncbi:hypothetical protein SALBM217S_05761 [Streptomyces griseoloalbus]
MTARTRAVRKGQRETSRGTCLEQDLCLNRGTRATRVERKCSCESYYPLSTRTNTWTVRLSDTSTAARRQTPGHGSDATRAGAPGKSGARGARVTDHGGMSAQPHDALPIRLNVDDNDSPSDVLDALFLGRFATGEQPTRTPSTSNASGRRDAPACGRAGAAARQGRRPQRHPGRGGRLDPAGLPLEPGRRRHGDRDQRRPGTADHGGGHRRRGRRARTAAGERHHGVLVRLPAARPAPHHPADRGRHLGGDPAQLHRPRRGRDGPSDEDHPRGCFRPADPAAARRAPARPPRCARSPGPGATGARSTACWTPSGSSPTSAI